MRLTGLLYRRGRAPENTKNLRLIKSVKLRGDLWRIGEPAIEIKPNFNSANQLVDLQMQAV